MAELKEAVTIKAPTIEEYGFTICGTAPYVQNNFAQKQRDKMHEIQQGGERAKKNIKREPKDFQAAYRGAMHLSREGWHGIPAPAFRAAMISACRVAGFAMTRAKLSVFVLADGFDTLDGTPLVRITKGQPEYVEHPVRNDNGSVDLRARPMWREGWEATVRIRWDTDQFSLRDVANLLLRAGLQVGVGEGRPDSKNSTGMGWGTFALGDTAKKNGARRKMTGTRARHV